MITKLILPDGTTLSSGMTGQAAILNFTYSDSVTADRELEPGACCAAMIRADILGDAPIYSGMELEVYRDELLLGRFAVKTIEKSGLLQTITAYDAIINLDADLTSWLQSRTRWPVPIGEFAAEVCEACGLYLANTPELQYDVPQFTASFVTGRQLMQWIGQAAGCFCRADRQGRVALCWYEENPISVPYYYQGSLKFSD